MSEFAGIGAPAAPNFMKIQFGAIAVLTIAIGVLSYLVHGVRQRPESCDSEIASEADYLRRTNAMKSQLDACKIKEGAADVKFKECTTKVTAKGCPVFKATE